MPPSTVEKFFTLVVLLLATNAFASLFVTPGEIRESQSIIGKLISGSIYFTIIFLLSKNCKGFVRIILQERLLLALLGLVICSTLWSDDPTTTIRRGLALVGTSLFGIYFSLRYDLRSQIRLLAVLCGFSIFWNYVFGLLHLGHSVDMLPGAWFGIYIQKNSLGRMMVLSAIVFFFLERMYPERRWLARICIALSFLLILLSKSQTALVVFSALLVILSAMLAFRRSVRRGITVLCLTGVAMVGAVYWAVTHIEITTQGLDRSVSLSGRLTLWILSVAMALQRPWLGYGYCAFWEGADGPSSHIWRAIRWPAPHAHNGFIDTWLDLGLVGLAFFLVCFAIYVRRALKIVMKSWPDSAWPLAYLSFIFLYNLTESTLLVRDTIFWALYSATAFSLFAQLERGKSPVRVRARKQEIAYDAR
jgi:O-antigen ligase